MILVFERTKKEKKINRATHDFSEHFYANWTTIIFNNEFRLRSILYAYVFGNKWYVIFVFVEFTCKYYAEATHRRRSGVSKRINRNGEEKFVWNFLVFFFSTYFFVFVATWNVSMNRHSSKDDHIQPRSLWIVDFQITFSIALFVVALSFHFNKFGFSYA